MTCKDCIHYDMCSGFTPTDLDSDVFDYCREGRTDEIPDIEERCSSFKDRNRFIELPCKAGDTVYVLDDFIWACDCGECKHFEEGWYDSPHECRKTRTSRKPPECIEIVERTVAYKDILQYMNWDDFGKTVFLTKEEAERALKEREQNG